MEVLANAMVSGNHFAIVNILYQTLQTLQIHSVICQLYLSNLEKIVPSKPLKPPKYHIQLPLFYHSDR